MKKQTALCIGVPFLGLVLVVTCFVLWFLGYVQGSVRMAKLQHKAELTLNLRAYEALRSNNVEKVKELIALDVWMNSGGLRLVMDDPYGYFAQCQRWRVASDEKYESKLREAERIRSDVATGYERIEEKGVMHYIPPSILDRE